MRKLAGAISAASAETVDLVNPRSPKLTGKPKDLRIVSDGDTMVVSFELGADEARARLTPAELDVLADLIEGRSNRDIAQRRQRSARTIANQVASVLRKLGLRSRLDVVVQAPVSR